MKKNKSRRDSGQLSRPRDNQIAEAIALAVEKASGHHYQILEFQMGRERGGKSGRKSFDCAVWLQDEEGKKVHLRYVGELSAGLPKRHLPGEENYTKPEAGPPVIEMPQYQLRLWAYPNDPGLPGLARLENKETLADLLERNPNWIGLPDKEITIDKLALRRIKYVPKMRASFLVSVQYRIPGQGGQPESISAFVKAVKTREMESRYKDFCTFVNKIYSTGNSEVLVPRLYGLDLENGLLWQEALPGAPVYEGPADRENLLQVAPEIGQRLAAFHQTELALSPGYDFEQQVREIHKTIALMEGAGLTGDFPLYRLAVRLLEEAEKIPAAARKTVHGSFKLSHVFRTPNGLYFIDCESVSSGDPAYDVGRFCAHIYKMALQNAFDLEYGQAIIARFQNGYFRKIKFPLQKDRVRWYTVGHLVASQGLKQLKRNRSRLLVELAELGEQLLATH